MVLDSSSNHLTLLLAFHAHQPVDNFDHVFKEAFEKSYNPFIETLSQFPEVKVTLHFSGSLLDWILENKPDFIHKVKNLVQRDQVEILTAGYYEPILVLLPERDRVEQITLHKLKMEELFGVKPSGLWLTERVWEPSLPQCLKKSGIKYTLVDDEHFKVAGYNPEDLWGYYITEEQLHEVAIFPGSKFLRYSLPFKLVEETVDYLRTKREHNQNCITFADDMEKFGFWPHTYDWVYEKGWLYKFFQALRENKNWVKTAHFKDVLESLSPSGRVYLPCASYSEMMDWCDNMFRNFLVKYPESNQLHKRMFYLSNNLRKVSSNINNLSILEAKNHLYKAQNNDVYWHGVFGGLYLTHLRHTSYQHLIKADKIIEKLLNLRFPVYEIRDYDSDGKKEIIFKSQFYNLYIAPEQGGMITEIDYKPADINIADTLTRRQEKYHCKILEREKVVSSVGGGDVPTSIHNLEGAREEGLENFLIYDTYRKSCWIDHLYSEISQPDLVFKNKILELYPFWQKRYRYQVERNVVKLSFDSPEVKLKKELDVKKEVLKFKCRVNSKNKEAKCYSTEFNFLFSPPEIISEPELRKVKTFQIRDDWFHLVYEIALEPAAFIILYPLYTISESEAGTERTYQGSCLHFIWDLNEGNLEARFQIKIGKR